MADDNIAELEAELIRTFKNFKREALRVKHLEAEMQRIADLTERWEDSLVKQVNEIAKAALNA